MNWLCKNSTATFGLTLGLANLFVRLRQNPIEGLKSGPSLPSRASENRNGPGAGFPIAAPLRGHRFDTECGHTLFQWGAHSGKAEVLKPDYRRRAGTREARYLIRV